jgi:hypothetical protein
MVMEQEAIRRDWDDFKESNPEIAKWLGDAPQFKDDKYWKPLQAADMLAWLVRNRKRQEKGLPSQHLLLPFSCPMISFGWNESGLRNLAKKMENLKPYLTGTWRELRFLSFIDPDEGTSFTVTSSETDIDDYIRRRKKRRDR